MWEKPQTFSKVTPYGLWVQGAVPHIALSLQLWPSLFKIHHFNSINWYMHFNAFIPPKKISNLCTCFPEFQLFDDLILVLKPTGLAMVNHLGPFSGASDQRGWRGCVWLRMFRGSEIVLLVLNIELTSTTRFFSHECFLP